MKFYRFNLNTDVEYEAVRSTVDSSLGYSGITCISPYATAPVDQRGRVLLSLSDNQPGYLSLVYQFGLLVTAKKAKELTQDEYDQSFAPASSGGVSSWNDLTDKPTSFTPSLHASTHASGGSDAVSIVAAQVSDFSSAVVAAAPPTTNASLLTSGTLADARLSGNVPLLVSGLIPSSYLPSYVDDVLEFSQLSAFPNPGETGKIYVALNTNLIYRWSGSVYIQVDPQPGTTDSLVEGTTNLYFTSARASAAAPVQSVAGKTGAVTLTTADIGGYVAPPVTSVAGRTGAVTLTSSDVGLGSVSNTSDASKPVSTAQAAADAAVQAYAIQRANHTGTQAASTITGLAAVATSGSASDLGAGTLPALRLPATTVTLGSYGSASSVATFTVGSDGRLTAAASTPIAISASQVTSGLASVATTGKYSSLTGTPTLATVAVTGNFADLASSAHASSHASGGSDALSLAASQITSGVLATARLASTGTASSTTYLRGDGTWSTPSGGSVATTTTTGTVIVPTSGNLTVDGSGNVSHTAATVSQSRGFLNTSVFMSPQRVRDAIRCMRTIPFGNAQTTNGGTTARNSGTPNLMLVNTTATTVASPYSSSYAQPYFAGAGASYTLMSLGGTSPSSADWTVPKWVHVRLWRQAHGTTSVLRFLFGNTTNSLPSGGTNPYVNPLAGTGIGFDIVGRRLWILCHDGTTAASYDTGLDTEADLGRPMDILLWTNGTDTSNGVSTAGTVGIIYQTSSTGPLSYTMTGGPQSLGSAIATLQLSGQGTACTWVVVDPTMSGT